VQRTRHRLRHANDVPGPNDAGKHGPAAAAPACGERARLLEHLDRRFAEKLQAIGPAADGGVLGILAVSNGSRTILITCPNRPTCVIATGQAFENLP